MSGEYVFYHPSCFACDRVIGALTADELAAFHSSTNPGLCFDCEPIAASHRPEILKDFQEDDTIRIGEMWFHVEADKLFYFGSSRARERAGKHAPGLSSSTYLNRKDKNTAILSNGSELGVCPECHGSKDLDGFLHIDDCGFCEGIGVVQTAIFLPAWILGLGCENV